MSEAQRIARLRAILSYDPETGIIRWRQQINNRTSIGSEAGCFDRHSGYRLIRIDHHRHRAHRLAWALHFGEWPVGFLDHRNGERSDNRIANLRLCTLQQNSRNQKQRSDTAHGGKKGIYRRKGGSWGARIKLNGKDTHLGTFWTASEAHAAYVNAANKYFGEFARTE